MYFRNELIKTGKEICLFYNADDYKLPIVQLYSLLSGYKFLGEHLEVILTLREYNSR